MAKLDKNQQQYALGRVDSLYGQAYRKLEKVEKPDVAALADALTKKGFIVSNRYGLANCVSLSPTAAQKKAEADREKKIDEFTALRDTAKDQIVLGDSEEVTKILTELASKFTV